EARELVGGLPPRAPRVIDADAETLAGERRQARAKRARLGRAERDGRGERGPCHASLVGEARRAVKPGGRPPPGARLRRRELPARAAVSSTVPPRTWASRRTR